MPKIVSNLELKLKLYPICAVLEMARLLRRLPTTPPLVPRMHLALNPLGRKLLPGAGTLGRGPKDPTLPTWGARAIPLRRSHLSPNDPNDPIQTSVVQAHANSGAPAQQATPQAPLPSPLYPWMRSQFGRFLLIN